MIRQQSWSIEMIECKRGDEEAQLGGSTSYSRPYNKSIEEQRNFR
jgi:hypothetical protein